MKIPNSPFVTRLSGSAGETELRLRSIFQWKKRRPPVIAFVAAFLVIAGCGSLVEIIPTATEPAGQDTLEKTETIAVSLKESNVPDVAAAMECVTTDDLVHSSFFEDRNAFIDEIALAFNAAAEHAIDEETVSSAGYTKPGTFPFWAIDVYYNVGSGMTTPSNPHFSIMCGLAENIVKVSLYQDGQWGTTYFEDETLYQLIRYYGDSEGVIDAAAFERFQDILIPKMEQTLSIMSENPANFTGYELTQFQNILTYEDPDDGSWMELYDFDFALLTEHPEQVEWAAGMYLDSDLRVSGLGVGPFAVRYRDGKIVCTAFMGRDYFFWPQADIESMDGVMEKLNNALDRTEEAGLR